MVLIIIIQTILHPIRIPLSISFMLSTCINSNIRTINSSSLSFGIILISFSDIIQIYVYIGDSLWLIFYLV